MNKWEIDQLDIYEERQMQKFQISNDNLIKGDYYKNNN